MLFLVAFVWDHSTSVFCAANLKKIVACCLSDDLNISIVLFSIPFAPFVLIGTVSLELINSFSTPFRPSLLNFTMWIVQV